MPKQLYQVGGFNNQGKANAARDAAAGCEEAGEGRSGGGRVRVGGGCKGANRYLRRFENSASLPAA